MADVVKNRSKDILCVYYDIENNEIPAEFKSCYHSLSSFYFGLSFYLLKLINSMRFKRNMVRPDALSVTKFSILTSKTITLK